MLSPEDKIMVPLSWKFRLFPGHTGLLTLMKQHAKQVVSVLGVVTDPTKGKLGYYGTAGIRKNMFGLWEISQSALTTPTSCDFKAREKLQQASSDRTRAHALQSQVTLPGKEPDKEFAEGKVTMELIVVINTSYNHVTMVVK